MPRKVSKLSSKKRENTFRQVLEVTGTTKPWCQIVPLTIPNNISRHRITRHRLTGLRISKKDSEREWRQYCCSRTCTLCFVWGTVGETHESARSGQLRVSTFLELVLLTLRSWIKATSIILRLRGSSPIKAMYFLFLHELVSAPDQQTPDATNWFQCRVFADYTAQSLPLGSQTGHIYHMKLKDSVNKIFHEVSVILWTLRLGCLRQELLEPFARRELIKFHFPVNGRSFDRMPYLGSWTSWSRKLFLFSNRI